MFLGENNTLAVIITAIFVEYKVEVLILVLRIYQRANGQTIIDIIYILLGIYIHKIQLEKYFTPPIKH